ncbi:MAG: PhoU domain-containing protein [Halobacteriota archaeon]|nr:PhoU domain-containing protein [Halobacteriota archaeon]
MEPRTGTRKIQTSASGSYYITLPRAWIDRNNVQKGDTIDLVCNGEDLHLLPPKNAPRKDLEKDLNLKSYSNRSLLSRGISHCYIQGYDIINIISDKPISREHKDWIKNEVVSKLMGTGITEESSDRIRIMVLIDPTKFPIDDLMKRMFNLVHSMHRDAVRSLEKRDFELSDDVVGRIEEVNKLYRLMLRQLMIAIELKTNDRSICVSRKEAFTSAIAARDISRMAFYAVDVATQMKALGDEKVDKSIIKDLIKLSNMGMDMQLKAIDAFFKNDFRLANSVIEELDNVKDLDYEIIEKISISNSSPKASTALTLISRGIRRIASYAVAIADDTQTKSVLD